jgi:hypothetical protein
MSRKLILAAAFTAFAVPALADTAVKVNVTGLDAKSAHAAIVQAAQTACRQELADQSDLVRYYNRPTCIEHAVQHAESAYAAMHGMASR